MRWMVVALLLASLLAGCSGSESKASVAAPAVPVDGVPPLVNATVDLPAPLWAKGQRFVYEMSGDRGQGSFDAIVVEDGGSYRLATSDVAWAKEDAAFDHPLLGTVEVDLAMEGWGGTWDLLDFPLRDGLQWSGTMPNLDFGSIDSDVVTLDLQATFAAALDTPAGPRPGYLVQGVARGLPIIDAEFVPEVGWFTRLTVLDIEAAEGEGQEPVEVDFRLRENGLNWTGTYYATTASLVLEHRDAIGFNDDPSAGGQFEAAVAPYASFDLSADATHLFGYLGAVVAFGTHQTVLLPPSGAPRHIDHTLPAGFGMVWHRVDEAAIPGTWHLASAGAGGHASGYAMLFEVTEATATL